ncbi:tRNA lysidine(34) synthetase TilS [Parasphingopyxis algicola]|uniref:tRNA lysidine(34) synthetase TilS n=1 Tax=Parasphingopyxis algicola TaxID=2026624 RepID=UPI0015A2A2F9|nr:tRNA lysidine(34) synthetase TilS [Parasphingopyxis algicola]QLC24970.1 tRNA lysidine(34) synthetase TilS [Parasphingopyxis algicola]
MPAQSLTDRFRAETERLTGAAPASDRRLGLAVSGGPDSLALLALAAEAYPGAVAAATIDHGLRPEAAAEAEHVAAICCRLDVPHAILAPEEPIGGNIQSAARAARYALLESWREDKGLGWIATAHHADDQLETILMRLMRGSGVDGLSAIRPVNGAVIRPLLGMRKAELVAHVAKRDLEAVADPSNADLAFDRVRMREALHDFPDFDPDRLARSVEALRDAAEALRWTAAREAEGHIESRDGAVRLDRTDYPGELLRRLVAICLERVDPGHRTRGPALDGVIDALSQGNKGTIGKILYFTESPEIWCFSKAPPRKTG